MTVNLSSRNFSLTIAGVDRTRELRSITLSQPSTLERRDAPITGSITLVFNPLKYNEYTTISSPAIAANWAVGALVVFQTANDSGVLVNNLLSGAALYILKEPSPPNVSFSEGTLQIEIGDILAYQSQRTADRDVSGVTIGTSTDRDEIVVKVLEDAGITSYSIPPLGYPFNTPVQKSGGSPIKLAGDLVGADRHVLYCNTSGTVIAAPIDLDASPIATLTIGADESSFEPVDGSAIPTVTELTISGVHQVPDRGDYPILALTEKFVNYRTTNFSSTFRVLTNKGTEEIQSENYSAAFEEIHYFQIVASPLDGGAILNEGEYFIISLEERFTLFDSKNRLSKTIVKKYVRLFSRTDLTPNFLTPFLEIRREITEYEYAITEEINQVIVSVFDGNITNTSTSALLSLSTVTRTFYNKLGTFWRKFTSNEIPVTQITFTGTISRTLTINGTSVDVIGCADNLFVETIETTSDSQLKNDNSTRPPSTTFSEAIKTKNEEIASTINALPLAGVPSKEKFSPITVDWLVSNAQAYEYGKLEIVLMNGRKQCRFMVTALTDELLTLRPRCRIDIIFNSILYRCLVDAIAFSQDLTTRTIGFMCDVISTSPVATPFTVYPVIKPVNGIRIIAQASPATGVVQANNIFNVIFAQAAPATAAINVAVNVAATITAQASTATAITSVNIAPAATITAQASAATVAISALVSSGDVDTTITAQASAAIVSISISAGDSDAIAVINAIEATGLTLSTDQKNAISARIINAKSDGVWSKWIAYYGFVGGTAAAHAINWKNPSNYAISWNGSPIHNSSGVKGDASTAYGNTNLNPNTLGLTTIGLGMYLTEAKTSAATEDSGGFTSSPERYVLLYIYSGLMYFYGGSSTGVNGTTSNDGAKQYASGNKIGGSIKTYRNGSVVDSASDSGTVMPNTSLWILNLNNAGSAGGRPSAIRMGSYCINTGLTDAEETANYISELAFQTALGRN